MSQYANAGIFRRIIVLVLEGYGVGALPDAGETRDRGADTLGHLATYTGGLNLPMLQWMGLGNVAAVRGVEPADPPAASFGRLARTSAGTDVDGALAELLDGLLEDLVASGNEVIAIGHAAELLDGQPVTVSEPSRRLDRVVDTVLDALDMDASGLIVASFGAEDANPLGAHGPARLARTLSRIDTQLARLFDALTEDTLLLVTTAGAVDATLAARRGTSREWAPLLAYTALAPSGIGLGDRPSLADVGATIRENFGLSQGAGTSFYAPLIP